VVGASIEGAWGVVALVALQVAVGAATVLLGLPSALQAAHVAVGTAVWGAIVLLTTSARRWSAGRSHILGL
jgi:heme A synthase